MTAFASSPAPAPAPAAATATARSWLTHTLSAFGPFIGLVAICILFAALRWETFVSWDNFAIILQQTAVIGIAALGMTLIIIAGGIDLSVGSIIALGTVVVAHLLNLGWDAFSAAAAGRQR